MNMYTYIVYTHMSIYGTYVCMYTCMYVAESLHTVLMRDASYIHSFKGGPHSQPYR